MATRKLSLDQAEAIRVRYVAGVLQKTLAVDFNCSPTTINHICQGRNYRNAGGPITPPHKRGA